MTSPLYTNRLIHEKSPYLLQHAHNPVNWYPWGDEAFTTAQEQDKPIFLSIGYATCHWCHVMESESFQSVEIAHLMNDTFINVKVDREEKPEVDSLYMEFAQAMMAGGAGWPLNLILTPELLPFFAVTYLPADAKRGFLGMKQLVLRIKQIWQDREEKESVVSQAGKIVDVFASHIQPEGEELPQVELVTEAAEMLYKTADPTYGGMKGAPKFPMGFQACFLLRFVRKTADSRGLFYVGRTLEMMRRGGIYDHLGGGFSRYSVDEKWFLPHFEKMLYDNALLARTYLEAWDYTREKSYRDTVEEILSYTLRDLKNPAGGFYSAEDADSEGREGKFYTWTWDEIHHLLPEKAPLFCEYYGVSSVGNFEGRSILHMRQSREEFAAQRKLDPVILENSLKEMRQALWKTREGRTRPAKDNKIIAAWNGLMIYSLAEAGRILQIPKYLDAAVEAADFIRTSLWKEGVLLRRWCKGEARFNGCLEDYAFVIHGLLSLFEADRGVEWLEFALTLTHTLRANFKAGRGAFYLTDGQDPNIILRSCEFYDGAEPSGNAIHTENLLKLYQITGVEDYYQDAADVLKAVKGHIDLYPPGACYHLMAMLRYYDLEAPTLVIALNDREEHKQEIEALVNSRFIPHKVLIWTREADEELRDLIPMSRHKTPLQGQTTLYICRPNRCEEPITDLAEMKSAIEKL